jgi:uncharacterized alkaline shock family protein YloU
VLDTIVALATQSVVGVAAVGAPGIAGLVQKGVAKGAARAVDVCAEDHCVSVTVHIQVFYGQRLKAVAEAVQTAVADAITSQVGIPVSAVDVFVDSLVFEK